jgi:hypothetical protein
MSRIPINQAVEVRWRLPAAPHAEGPVVSDVVTRSFPNLVPACEFAVAMANEGNRDFSLHPDSGPVLDLAAAQRIKAVWESGAVSLEAEELEY